MTSNIRASLCITCYNQATFIRAALESAFAQTYPDLEIVICDDCSTDETDEIIRAMIVEYRGKCGRHSVAYKRNEHNLGVARNYDQCFRMAHGDLLVTGSGDDISLPNRVERLVEYWRATDCKAMAIIHNGYLIDCEGRRHGQIGRRGYDYPLGAATAYSRLLFKYEFTFPEGVYEDHLYAPVAEILGGVHFLDECLMEYRLGSGLSTRGLRKARIRTALAGVNGDRQTLLDLEKLKEQITPVRYKMMRTQIQDWIKQADAGLLLYGGRTFAERLKGFRVLKAQQVFSSLFLQQLFFLLPPSLGDICLWWYGAFRRFFKQ